MDHMDTTRKERALETVRQHWQDPNADETMKPLVVELALQERNTREEIAEAAGISVLELRTFMSNSRLKSSALKF